MKKITLFAIILILSPISIFALNPLNETFENFTISSTPLTSVSSTPAGYIWINLTSPTISIQVVDNPNKSGINTSNKVLQINRSAIDTLSNDKSASGFAYRGAFSTSYDFPMTATNCIIEAKVLKTVSGKVGIRLYPSATGSTYTIVTADVTGSPDWQTVQFNFSALVLTMTPTPKINFEIEKSPTVAGQKGALTVWVDDIKLLSSINSLNESFEATNGNIWKAVVSTRISSEIVSNPLIDATNTSSKVLKIIKTGSSASQYYDLINTYAYPTILTKTNNTVQMHVLFRASDNVGVTTTKFGLRLGGDYNSDIQKTLTVSDSWQTLNYDYSTLTKYNNVFKLNKDTLSTVFSILPREDKLTDGTSSLDGVIIYVDNINVIANVTNSINAIDSDNRIFSYIDPTTSMLKIQNLPTQSCMVKVINLSGVECKKTETSSTSMSVDISTLIPGIYIISCYSNSGKLYADKLIKW